MSLKPFHVKMLLALLGVGAIWMLLRQRAQAATVVQAGGAGVQAGSNAAYNLGVLNALSNLVGSFGGGGSSAQTSTIASVPGSSDGTYYNAIGVTTNGYGSPDFRDYPINIPAPYPANWGDDNNPAER